MAINPSTYDENISIQDILHMADDDTHYGHVALNLPRKCSRKIEGNCPELDALLARYDERVGELRAEVFPEPIRVYAADPKQEEKWSRRDRRQFIREMKKILRRRKFYWYGQEKKLTSGKVKKYWVRKWLRKGEKSDRPPSCFKQLRITLCPAQILYYRARIRSAPDPVAEREAIIEELEQFLPKATVIIQNRTTTVAGQPSFACETPGANWHFDTGLWHCDLLVSKAREYTRDRALVEGIPIDKVRKDEPTWVKGLAPIRAGKKELGKRGKWMVGANLQVLCGYKLPPVEAKWFESHEAISAERYGDSKGIDVELNEEMFLYGKSKAIERGDLAVWEKAEAEYVSWLQSVEPLKAQIYTLGHALKGDVVRDRLDDAGKQRHSEIEGVRKSLRTALYPRLFDGAQMRKLAGLFPLRKVAEAIVDEWTDMLEILNAAAAGFENLIKFLSELFAKGGKKKSAVETPRDFDMEAAVEAAVAARPPRVVEREVVRFMEKPEPEFDLDRECARLGVIFGKDLLTTFRDQARKPRQAGDPYLDARGFLRVMALLPDQGFKIDYCEKAIESKIKADRSAMAAAEARRRNTAQPASKTNPPQPVCNDDRVTKDVARCFAMYAKFINDTRLRKAGKELSAIPAEDAQVLASYLAGEPQIVSGRWRRVPKLKDDDFWVLARHYEGPDVLSKVRDYIAGKITLPVKPIVPSNPEKAI